MLLPSTSNLKSIDSLKLQNELRLFCSILTYPSFLSSSYFVIPYFMFLRLTYESQNIIYKNLNPMDLENVIEPGQISRFKPLFVFIFVTFLISLRK